MWYKKRLRNKCPLVIGMQNSSWYCASTESEFQGASCIAVVARQVVKGLEISVSAASYAISSGELDSRRM